MNRPRIRLLKLYLERLTIAWTILRGRGAYLSIRAGSGPSAVERHFIGTEVD